ncbi:hypothetical protein GWK47_045780 [Chionoecetes opilio]|uniref:Uncharacterized protein n=1 Tax=Chionoecetes opilio TaxID=41210 RepID=A0A8J4YDL3_CHIOP|nr:hypothetical protein GWK47_045780 [Chionoecetes opilio]
MEGKRQQDKSNSASAKKPRVEEEEELMDCDLDFAGVDFEEEMPSQESEEPPQVGSVTVCMLNEPGIVSYSGFNSVLSIISRNYADYICVA